MTVDPLPARGAALRRHLAAVAASIAGTEDRLADTFERLASSRPHDAIRLLAQADRARQYAACERDRAADYGYAADCGYAEGEPGEQ